jgi:AraC-like DNA-binding protein
MKYRDTTDPATRTRLVPLITEQTRPHGLDRAASLRFRLVGLYHSRVDREWSSGGRAETDVFHYIHFACAGQARIRQDVTVFELRPGEAHWLSGNTPVVREPARDYEAYVLKFRCESSTGADILLDWPGRGPRHLGPWDRDSWEPLWSDPARGTEACLALQGWLRLWLARAFPDLDAIIARHHQRFAAFANVLQALETKLGADLRVSDLAKVHGTSLHAFSMAFERGVGLSPKAYLNRRLNEEACDLLLNSDQRIKELARHLRFSDEFYFSRFFKKMNGVSPVAYRQRFATDQPAET